MEKVLKIDRENPDLSLLRRAARSIQKGEVIAFPTDTFYGLGADALNPRAVEKVFEIKQRDRKKPILVLVSNFGQAADLVKDVPSEAWRLMSRFWPGPLTLVFVASAKVPDLITAGTGKIGIRVPGDPLTTLLLRTFAVPITATSANRSGAASPTTAQEVLETLGHDVALILDAGKTPGGMPSTVVDVTTSPITLLREGQISAEMLK